MISLLFRVIIKRVTDKIYLLGWKARSRAFCDGKLSPEKTALLNELKIDWLLPMQRAWENAFSLAKNFLINMEI